ncbi:hypothetical protein HHK36_019082 [Tetracentron sinense]|uniref:Uncharacterized protein n=1 Tax=Tetracentron sinense TaxID=13715 RepID=A0A834YYN2_TETSI|nr:hypothetical protein HHK36_019082 [Tetracentron sinense]
MESLVGETVTIVGDHDPALMKYFDCTRSSHRSAFDGNVVYQFEIMEYISAINGFERMGADNGSQNRLITLSLYHQKCMQSQFSSSPPRSKLAELLFEGYGVPSVAFGVDAVFSYNKNQQLGVCDKDGLAIMLRIKYKSYYPCKLINLDISEVSDGLISRFSCRMSGHIGCLGASFRKLVP